MTCQIQVEELKNMYGLITKDLRPFPQPNFLYEKQPVNFKITLSDPVKKTEIPSRAVKNSKDPSRKVFTSHLYTQLHRSNNPITKPCRAGIHSAIFEPSIEVGSVLSKA